MPALALLSADVDPGRTGCVMLAVCAELAMLASDAGMASDALAFAAASWVSPRWAFKAANENIKTAVRQALISNACTPVENFSFDMGASFEDAGDGCSIMAGRR
ncbi:MAG: hypothetical protein ACM34A_18665 [Bacillota bacterium]